MKQMDDMRRVGAAVSLLVGAWALIKGIEMGLWWKGAFGFALIVWAFVLAYYHRRESNFL
jgi:hypothetical protein